MLPALLGPTELDSDTVTIDGAMEIDEQLRQDGGA
jgi:hypothetical protein